MTVLTKPNLTWPGRTNEEWQRSRVERFALDTRPDAHIETRRERLRKRHIHLGPVFPKISPADIMEDSDNLPLNCGTEVLYSRKNLLDR